MHQDWEPVVFRKKVDQKSVPTPPKPKDENPEVFHQERVSKELAQAIISARTARKLTQKQLAMHVNVQPSVINEIESGKAVYNAGFPSMFLLRNNT